MAHFCVVLLTYAKDSPGWDPAGDVIKLFLIKTVSQDVIIVFSLHVAVCFLCKLQDNVFVYSRDVKALAANDFFLEPEGLLITFKCVEEVGKLLFNDLIFY